MSRSVPGRVLLVNMSCPRCGTGLEAKQDAFICPSCDAYCGGPDGLHPIVSPVHGAPDKSEPDCDDCKTRIECEGLHEQADRDRAMIEAFAEDLTTAQKQAIRYLRACKRVHRKWKHMSANWHHACGSITDLENRLTRATARITKLEKKDVSNA